MIIVAIYSKSSKTDTDGAQPWSLASSPWEHWHEAIGNPTLADAILDRLIHNAHKVALKGELMRKKVSH
jgi:DNA replication protein DnaC